jgi:hypothetical protein
MNAEEYNMKKRKTLVGNWKKRKWDSYKIEINDDHKEFDVAINR